MSIIYVLIPIAMLFVIIAVSIFFWAVKSEQFDDLDRQSVSILFDEDDTIANNNASASANTNTKVDDDSSINSSAIKHSLSDSSTSDIFTSENDVTSSPIDRNVKPVGSTTTHIKAE